MQGEGALLPLVVQGEVEAEEVEAVAREDAAGTRGWELPRKREEEGGGQQGDEGGEVNRAAVQNHKNGIKQNRLKVNKALFILYF